MPKSQSPDYKVEFALMKADIASLKSDVSDIKNSLKEFIDKAPTTFFPRTEAELRLKNLEDKLSVTRTDLQKVVDWLIKLGPYIAIVIYMLLGKVF